MSGPPGAADRIISSLRPAMVVVTAGTVEDPAGCLVGFSSQCSIDPLRFVVWLSERNETYRRARGSTRLGVHFPADDQHDLATDFGSVSGPGSFAGHPVERGAGGVPMLVDCPRRFVGRVVQTIGGDGDHAGFVLEPIEARAPSGPWQPLDLGAVRDVEAGNPP